MFVTFEGPEGAGKSTALAAVATALQDKGYAVTTTREPGAGPLGQEIRAMVLHGHEINPRTELLLFLADRANHVDTVIKPALERGEIVLCDRFADSSLVYQAYARGLSEAFVRAGNEFATAGLKPSLTLLFDLDPEVGLARLQSKDRLDAQPIEFHRAVREGFLREAKAEPGRWVRVDAHRSAEETAKLALIAILDRYES